MCISVLPKSRDKIVKKTKITLCCLPVFDVFFVESWLEISPNKSPNFSPTWVGGGEKSRRHGITKKKNVVAPNWRSNYFINNSQL